MNTRVLSTFLILTLGSQVSATESASQTEAIDSSMVHQLESGSISAADFEEWVSRNFEILSTNQLSSVYETALSSNDHSINELGIRGAISMLGVLPSGEPTFKVQQSQGMLFLESIRVLVSSDDPGVRRAAFRYLAVATPRDFGAEEELVKYLQREESIDVKVELITLIGHEGVSTTAARDALLSQSQSGINQAAHRSLRILLSDPDNPPRQALEPAINVVQSSPYFADPNLVQYIPRFGADARTHLPALRELLSELEKELELPPANRTKRIYNDGFYRSALRAAISQIEAI